MRLNQEMVEKNIRLLQQVGRTVDVVAARAIGAEIIRAGRRFDTASDAAEWFRIRIWDARLVK